MDQRVRQPRRTLIAILFSAFAVLSLAGVGSIHAVAAPLSVTNADGPISLTESADSPAAVGMPVIVNVAVTNTSQVTQSNLQLFGVANNSLLILKVVSTHLVSSCQPNDGNWAYFCILSPLDAGATATVTASVTPVSTDPLVLTARASGGQPEGSAFENLTLPVNPPPTDVQVTGSASTGSPARGATFTYTFQIKDNGPQPAPGVTFSDSLPAAVTFASVSTTQGSCSQAGGAVSCTIGDLGVGSQAKVVITVQAPAAPSTFANTASIAMPPSMTDSKPANDLVAVTVQVK